MGLNERFQRHKQKVAKLRHVSDRAFNHISMSIYIENIECAHTRCAIVTYQRCYLSGNNNIIVLSSAVYSLLNSFSEWSLMDGGLCVYI